MDELGHAPCVQLGCGHVFNLQCVRARLDARWPGARISFGYLNCPLCAQPVTHPGLNRQLAPHRRLQEEVRAKAMERLVVEGMQADPPLLAPAHRFFRQPLAYAQATLAFYLCSQCHKPYFGGKQACDAEDVGRALHETRNKRQRKNRSPPPATGGSKINNGGSNNDGELVAIANGGGKENEDSEESDAEASVFDPSQLR